MVASHAVPLRPLAAVAALAVALALALAPTASAAEPTVSGPIPGAVPGDPLSGALGETYPFFSTWLDLQRHGYVEEEYYLSGDAAAYSTAGARLASDVPYTTRIVVRRPTSAEAFNGTVLMEWQNVTAGYDLDALWNFRLMREGFAWVGVSAQRVGVTQLRGWSPSRYGSLDVTGMGAYVTDQLSYDIFAQAAAAVKAPPAVDPMGGLPVAQVLAIGASQSAGRMVTYYNSILPQVTPVFDGYAFIVGSGPSRVGTEPVFHVLSETDVSSSLGRRANSSVYRRWEVAGAAHSGWEGQEYRGPLSERDLGAAPQYECTNPPFSRVPMGQVTTAAYVHLRNWVAAGTPPPIAPHLQFTGILTKTRNELGLAQGGIQLSQVSVPIALNTGSNSGVTFCSLFGTYRPFSDEVLAQLYRNHGSYVDAVGAADAANVEAGFILAADAALNQRAAAQSGIGKKK